MFALQISSIAFCVNGSLISKCLNGWSNNFVLFSNDLNNDGINDFFVGGAKFQKSELFLSKGNSYKKVEVLFNQSISSEDTDAIFFDVDKLRGFVNTSNTTLSLVFWIIVFFTAMFITFKFDQTKYLYFMYHK